MALGMIYLGLPLLLYLGLVVIPPGRPALRACAAAAAVIALLWIVYLTDMAGIARAPSGHGSHFLVLLFGLSTAWAVAASLQLLRLRLPRHWPGWSWTLIALIALAAVSVPVIRLFGL